MDVRQFIVFERVVREGSFSKAAWALGVSQPTVSSRIQALELEVGGALFRRGRKIALTDRGANFLPHVRRMLAALNDGLEAARFDSGALGRLSIGALRSLAGGLLGRALLRFHELSPEVECYAREGDHWQLVELLADRVIELALVCWPVQDPSLVDMTPVFRLREPMVVVAHPDHPLAGLGTVSRAKLLELADPFLLLRWWQTTPPEIAGLVARARRSMDVPIDAGRYLVLSGRGVGFFPKMLVRANLERGELVEIRPVDAPDVYRDTALVHLSRREGLSGSAEQMIEVLLTEVRLQGIEHERR